jgi:signal transduction histidine kinase
MVLAVGGLSSMPRSWPGRAAAVIGRLGGFPGSVPRVRLLVRAARTTPLAGSGGIRLQGDPFWPAAFYHQVVKRLAVAVAGLPAWGQDLILAVALTVVDVAVLLFYRSHLHPWWAAMTLVAAETLPLTWRRSWPVLTFLVVGTARVSYDVAGLAFAPLPLGPAIAYYTVIERCPTRVRWAVTGLVPVGMIISQAAPGHSQPYDFTVAVLTFLTAGLAGMLSRTRRAYLRAAEARAASAEARRDQETAGAAAAERTRIARELHDVVAHHVSLMAVQAEAARSLLPGRPDEAARSVDVIGATARAALTELRRLLGVLRGPADSLETAPAVSLAGLDGVLDQIRRAGLPVELTVTGPATRLSQGTDLTAYRIIQEALTNSMRHARASRAEVRVAYEPGYVTVQVTDDGEGRAGGGLVPVGTGPGQRDGSPAAGRAGFGLTANSQPASGRAGFGLAGIAERVASCGGSLAVGPTSTGFAVTARLPTP